MSNAAVRPVGTSWRKDPARGNRRLEEAFRGAAARLVVSPELGRVLESYFGDSARPWIWVPNIVDSRFAPGEESGEGQTETRPFRFLNVALLTEKKGHQDLLRAFASQFKGGHQAELRIGGDGPIRGSLARLASELGIASQVTFLGMLSRERVLEEMQQSDVFVLSSHYETFGVVLIEALACGKPVIATACGGPESIVHSGNGLLVPPRDPAALGSALVQMQTNRATYDATSIRANCLARFGSEAVSAQLSKVYMSVQQGVE